MKRCEHIVIVAGEESGDAHASVLIKQLKTNHPNIRISGIGGRHMQEAGAELISDLARFGVTGFTEVIRYLKVIKAAFLAIKKHLRTNKPDLLILVDYPGFNLRLAKYAKKKLGLKIIYYISPQIWAWKANRIHLIKQCVDRMAVILPFEKTLYENAGVPVSFVGHPLVENIPSSTDQVAIRTMLQLPLQKRIIACLPGSRTNEIERHMPVVIATAKLLHQQHPDFHFVIPIAETINPDKIKSFLTQQHLPLTCVQGKAIECMAAADFVVVASGTASLECALLKKPMCIIYKSSLLTYYLVMKLIKVKFLGLCNLLSNKMIAPEFLHYDCNPIELSQYILNFYKDPNQPEKIIQQLASMKNLLSSKESDCSLLELVENELPEINA